MENRLERDRMRLRGKRKHTPPSVTATRVLCCHMSLIRVSCLTTRQYTGLYRSRPPCPHYVTCSLFLSMYIYVILSVSVSVSVLVFLFMSASVPIHFRVYARSLCPCPNLMECYVDFFVLCSCLPCHSNLLLCSLLCTSLYLSMSI